MKATIVFFFLLCSSVVSIAETNGLAQTPIMGWSSWSFIHTIPTEASIEAQALALHNSGLQSLGYNYVNIDNFWEANPDVTVDQYGRWVVNSNSFPDGIAAVANYVHNLGLKFGIYIDGGIPIAAYNQNTPIEGTTNFARGLVTSTNPPEYSEDMYYIDYSQPGAQAYINSWADEFASWGIDYVKIDDAGDTDIPDIQAWSQALNQSGRPIHFELSNNLDPNNGAIWEQYGNGFRVDNVNDIEYGACPTCFADTGPSVFPLTSWTNCSLRFGDQPFWTQFDGPGGWSDLDSLEVGNGTNSGLTETQLQTIMTLWSISCSSLLLGTDLTALQTNDLALLSNPRVLQLNQSGSVAVPLTYNSDFEVYTNGIEVWRAAEADGSYALALFNLTEDSTNISVTWAQLGFTGGAEMQDLWSGNDLGFYASGCNSNVPAYGSMLFRVAPTYPASRYLAAAPGNTLAGGAVHWTGANASGGMLVGVIGEGGTLTFNNIVVPSSGSYNATFLFYNGDPSRSANISVNGGTPTNMTFGTSGSWYALASQTLGITLQAGTNTIEISNPSGYAPNFDSVVIQNASIVVPTAPTNIIVTPGNSQMTLSWPVGCGATGYKVKYGTSSGAYSATNSSASAGITITGLTNGLTYYLVITATNSVGTSPNSSQIATFVGPPAAPPAGLTATPGNAQVILTWTAVPGATSYNVARSSSPTGPYTTIANVNAVATTYTDASVSNGDTYYYTVSALNGAAQSVSSAPVIVIPLLPEGTYTIISQQSGLALDDPDGGGNNTGVDQYPDFGTNQQWTIVPVSGSQYKIISASGYALSGPTTNSQLVLQPYTGAVNQLWTFEALESFGSDWFIMVNFGSGQVMADFGDSTTSGSPIGQWVPDGGHEQNWSVRPVSAPFTPYQVQKFGIHFLGNTTDHVTGYAGAIPIPNWNNITNGSFTLGSWQSIASSDGQTLATLSLSGGAANNTYSSGATNNGQNGSLMDGYIDAGQYGGNYHAIVTISNLTGSAYNVYVYTMSDSTRPTGNADYLPNYTVNGTTYYVPVLGAKYASTYDTTDTSVGGVGFTGLVEGTTLSTNSANTVPAADFGNYIEITNVVPANGVITVEAEADTLSFRSPLNGIELVYAPPPVSFGVHFLGNTTDHVTGYAGAVPIPNWNNITNGSFTLGSWQSIASSYGQTTATLSLSGGAANNTYSSGATNNGQNGSLMDGYIDAGQYGGNYHAIVTISNLTGSAYNVYAYSMSDSTRPTGNADYLPNYTVNGTTYYVPVLGAKYLSDYDTTDTSVGGVGFTGLIEGTTLSTNSDNPPPAADFGNYIEITNVASVNGAITIEAEADTLSYRSPLNGIELVYAPPPVSFGIHFLGNTTDYVTGYAGAVPIPNWNNITNGSFTLGSWQSIVSSDGQTLATLSLSGGAANNTYSSGATGDGQDGSLMDGYIDAGQYGTNYHAIVTISNLTSSAYNIYVYSMSDSTRPTGNADYLPNYTVNGTTYYVPVLGAKYLSDYDTTDTSVGGVGFTGLIEGTTLATNSDNPPPAADFGNYIEIANVAPVNGVITVEAEADTLSYRSPLNGIELVSVTGAGIPALSALPFVPKSKINNFFVSLVKMTAQVDGTQGIVVEGQPGQSYLIEATSSLVNPVWTEIGVSTADANGQFTFIDSGSSNEPTRFYRFLIQ